MKGVLRFPKILLTALLLSAAFTSCEEEKDNTPPPPPVFNSNTIEGMLYYYTNEAEGRIRVLDATNAFRKSYRLSDDEEFVVDLQLIVDGNAEDHVIKAYPSTPGSPSYPKGKFIKPKMKNKNWLLTGNVIANLMSSTESRDWWTVRNDTQLLHSFIFHHMGVIDGEDVYAIESMYAPGYYISHQGHPIQGTNVLTYYEFGDPENAPQWRLFRPKGLFMEGDPQVGSI